MPIGSMRKRGEEAASDPLETSRGWPLNRHTGTALLALVVRGMEAGGKFGLYALTARTLGGKDSGLFFLCLSILHFSASFARMGLERAITRHVAAEFAIGRADLARKVAWQGGGAMLAASLAVALLILGVASPIATGFFHQPELVPALRITALIVPANNLAFAVAFVLMGMDRGTAAQLVMNALVPAISLVALILGVRNLHLLLAVYGAAFGACGMIGLSLIVLQWRGAKQRSGSSISAEALPSLWQSARPLYVFELGQAFLLSLPIFALGRFADPVSLSEFSIASRLSMLAATIVLSIGQVFSPVFARHYRRGELAELWLAYRRARAISLLICLPLLLLMIVGAGPLLGLLGSASRASVTALWILVLGQFLNSVLPCQDVLLAMTGHGDVLRRLMYLQLTACILASLVLVPIFGVAGAAIAGLGQWGIAAVGGFLAVRHFLPQLHRSTDGIGQVGGKVNHV